MEISTVHFEPGTRCWIPDKEKGWLGVQVIEMTHNNDKYQIKLVSEEDPERTFNIETDNLNDSNKDLPLMRNQMETVEDLTELSHLNEPSILNAIKVRYSQFNIYTYSGIVLIATNPFQRNEELYSQHRIQRYASKRRGEEEPHLFAIAEEAYRCMINNNENQSIVVSGESGAGKTVSAKYIMRYFATVDSDANNHDMSKTEKQILATNPIMESFGNAKTTRNDNSSRFGKYLEILFDNKTVICGAKIRTYLLERSRLVFQPKTERNYHIFYQMIQGLDNKIKDQLGLISIECFHYLNQGGLPLIDGIDEVKEFKETCDALSLVGIDGSKQLEIFRILAALLHIGNIVIPKTKNDASLSSDEPNLVKACELLGLDPVNFAKWTIKKQIVTRSEKIVSNLKYNEAIVARDSVAKYIYATLFDWLVEYVNSDLCPADIEDKVKTFIGVLDIYGFEHFDKNSFEQFCINYANEKLQQEFTQHVFKLEQDEYVKEEIEWSFIEFSDNQPCIDVIENRLGILSLLDEESRLPAGSDQSWTEKMYQTLSKPPHEDVFKKPRFGNNKFIVSHYALDVSYDTEGFIDKNRDTVSDGQLETLKNSTNPFLLEVLGTIEKLAAKVGAEQPVGKPGRKVIKKPTLGSIFKLSLIDLMKTINSTNVHYIRCIKPNEEKKAWEFDPNMVLSQLRACGVLETIKISCAGFPSRSSYPEFVLSYAVLLPSKEREKFLRSGGNEQEAKEITKRILEDTIYDDHKFQTGKTKIFFKAGILGYLEKLRSDKIKQSATIIQKHLRGYQGRKQYLEIRESLINLQALLKGYLVRNRIKEEKERESATKIQSLVRGHFIRIKFISAIKSLIELQAILRGAHFRNNLHKQLRKSAAITLQSAARGCFARKDYNKVLKSSIVIQCGCRKFLAKKEYAALRTEAKSLNKMQEVQYSLENKVIELTQSLTGKIEENSKLVNEIQKLQSLVQETQNEHESLKTKNLEFADKHNSEVESFENNVLKLNTEIDHLRINYETAKNKVEELTESQSKLREELKENIAQLKQAQLELSESNKENTTLNGSIEQLKQEINDLQQHLSSGRFNNATVGRELPNGNAPLSFNENRGTTIDISNGGDEGSLEAINVELLHLLKDSKSLHKEIVDGLLKGLKLPPAYVASETSRKEVLFPARIIIIILSDMWRLGLTSQSEAFLGEVLSVIQNIVTGLNEEDVIPYGAFWLTNTHELYSFVAYAQSTILGNESISQEMGEEEYDLFLKLIADAKEDFESLSYNIYNIWMKKMLNDLEKKCISAVVLGQALPGFIAQDSSPLISKMFQKDPKYKMDDILTFFNNAYWAMKSYFFEVQVLDNVIIEMLKFVNALCFNDLIMRRNFLSWKRGLQLNYNVTRLEEWCKGHDIPDGSKYLAHLLQVSKLLQLRKNTPEDVDIIYEICYALKAVQIQKLFSQYQVADYETPISPMITQTLAEKVKKSGGSTDFFEPLNRDTLFEDPFRRVELRPFNRIEAYVPARLNVPNIRRIVELATKNASVQENMLEEEVA